MSDEYDAINPDYARENPNWRKTGAADLPASLREAIERVAEHQHREVAGEYGCGWPHVRCPAMLKLIADYERIARLTLEAERQRQTQLSTAEWLQQQTLISDLYRASAERQQEIAMDALRDREDAIRRAQRDPAPPRDDKEPKP